MKKLVLIVIVAAGIATACKREKNESPDAPACPVISSTSVPAVVKDSFAARYPADSVNTWFRKDSIGYCAYFIPASLQKTLAEFSNTGSFIAQTIETGGEDNETDDSTATAPKGGALPCECEIPED